MPPARRTDEDTIDDKHSNVPIDHNLEFAAFSPATVNVVAFDPECGADQSRKYPCKYCGKPEPWYYLQTTEGGEEANPVKQFLKSRNVGLCMCHNRLLGLRVVRSTRPTHYIYPQFTVEGSARIQRSPEHVEKYSKKNGPQYPDEEY